MSQEAVPNKDRLNSWKEIASYFGNDQRTVKRWESARGLPVRRLPGARSGVYALVSEIEAWQRGELVPAKQADFDDAAPGPPTRNDALDQQAEPEPASQAEAARSVQEEKRPASADPAAKASKPSRHWAGLLLGVSTAVVALLLFWQFRAHAAVKQARHLPPAHARELYLQGRYLWDKRTPEALKASLADFEEATRIDPQYAAAYAGIADCYALSPEFAPKPNAEIYPRMLAAAQKALVLDNSLAEGHRARGFALFYWNLDQEASRAEFEQALRIAPNDPTTHLWFANTLANTGHRDEALKEIERAREIDPAAAAIVVDRGWVLYSANRREEALQVWKRVAQTDPGYSMVHVWMAEYYFNEHQPREYLQELKTLAGLRNTEVDRTRYGIAERSFNQSGEPAMRSALARYEQELYRQGKAPAFMVAVAMVRAGEHDAAMNYLEIAYRTRDEFSPGLDLRRDFLPLHGTPRFQKLLIESRVPFPETDGTEVAAATSAAS